MRRLLVLTLLWSISLSAHAEPQEFELWGEQYSLERLLAEIEKSFHQDASMGVCEIPSFDQAILAGPRLLDLFEMPPSDEMNREWASKHAIAGCLGMIGFQPAIPSLINALDTENDCRLILLSARSLGLLRAQAALPVLRQLESSHWYPPIREHAALARKVIEGNASYLPSSFMFKPSRHSFAGRTSQSVHLHRLINWVYGWGRRYPLTAEELAERAEKLAQGFIYREPIYTRGLGELSPIELALCFYWNSPESERRKYAWGYQVPDCGLYWGDGILLGKDNGEWGGDLIHYRPFREPRYLLNGGIAAIHRVGGKVLVFPAQGHGTANTMVYEVIENSEGEPNMKRWKLLPGGHNGSGWNEEGEFELWLNNDAIIVEEDGELRMASE